MSYPSNGPVAVGNPSTMQHYDKFQMRSAPISQPIYKSNLQIAPYKAGGGVIRPRSAIKGRSLKADYGYMKTNGYPEFYPIYGPQGDHKRHQYPYEPTKQQNQKPKENNEKPPKERKERKDQGNKDDREPQKDKVDRNNRPDSSKKDKRAEQGRQPKQEKPDTESKREPKTYYNNRPDTRDRYTHEQPPVEEERKRQKEVANEKEKKGNDLPRKDAEKPVKKTERKEPVIAELHQSKLRKKAAEPNKDTHKKPDEAKEEQQKKIEEPRENRPVPRQEREEVQKRDNKDVEEKIGNKNKEAPEKRNNRVDPVYTDLYQSKLKQKKDEPNKKQEAVKQKPVEEKREIHEEKEVEREVVHKRDNKDVEDTIGKRNKEAPETRNKTIDPVYTDLYQSKLKQKTEDPNKKQETVKQRPAEETREKIEDKKVENKHTKQEQEKVQKEEKENSLGHKDKENPDSINDQMDPVIRELHRSKLKKDESSMKKQEKVKPIPTEEKKVIKEEKKQEKEDAKEEQETEQNQDEEVSPGDRDKEHPEKRHDTRQPVIRELYKSKLREKVDNPSKKKQEEAKPVQQEHKKEEVAKHPKTEDRVKEEEKKKPEDAKKDDKKQIKTEDKEEVKELKKEDKEDYKREPILEEKKKDPKEDIKKNEPEKKENQEEKGNPYAHRELKDDEKQNEHKEERPKQKQPKEPPQKTKKEEPRRADVYNTEQISHSDEPLKKPKPRPKREVIEEERAPVRRRNIKGRDSSSVRARYYEQADMEEVLQDKIAFQLRENGVAETKVVPVSAKITQAVKDDVINASNKASPQVTANLKEVINKHLDPVLFNKADVTDLRDLNKPSDARHLSNLVLLRVAQVHEEVDLCRQGADDLKNKRDKSNTPRDNSQNRSAIMEINDSIKKQKTENDILRDKLKKAQRDSNEVTTDKDKRHDQLQNLDTENWKLQQDLNTVQHEKHNLLAKVKSQQKDYNRLDKQHQELRQENTMLINKLNDTDIQNQYLSEDLIKLQSENARLKVLVNQKEKEILHLRDPDQEMLHQIKVLSDEVTLLRTQTRRLNEEKGLLKTKSQKLEASLDDSSNQKHKLAVDKDKLQEENEDLKQRYRKLALANPQQRLFPDINTGRNGPSSRANSRSNSRANSRNIHNSDDRRMSTALEEEEQTQR